MARIHECEHGRHLCPICDSNYVAAAKRATVKAAIIQIWDDLHCERSGFYRAFWCDDAEATCGSPVVGYCSPGGTHRTIRAAIAECRRLGHGDPVYRNGRLISGGEG